MKTNRVAKVSDTQHKNTKQSQTAIGNQQQTLDLNRLDPATVLQLQRTGGNKLVKSLLDEQPSVKQNNIVPLTSRNPETLVDGLSGSKEPDCVQRDGESTVSTTIKPANPTVGTILAQNVLEQVRVDATARTFSYGAYSTKAINTLNTAKTNLVIFSERYDKAYQKYAEIIGKGRAEAQNQQEWIDIFAGIAIGVGVGLLSGAIVGGATLTLAQTVLVEVAGEAVEAATAAGAKQLGVIPQVEGTSLEPTGVHPDLLNSKIWQNLALSYQNVTKLQELSWHLPLLLGNTEYVLGQLRLSEAGADCDMSEDDVLDFALSLSRVNSQMKNLDEEISRKMQGIDKLASKFEGVDAYSEKKLEQDIWIMWISTLAEDQSDILDLDEIEDYLHRGDVNVLGSGSRLGVDFGWWTSKDDEMDAISAARSEANQLKSIFNKLQ